MTTPMRRSTEIDHAERINRAIDAIWAHLSEPQSVARIASFAHFSPFHFHRAFRSLTGETVKGFVLRARLARAALLLGRARSDRTLTRIALDCGFSSLSELSRHFRAGVGCTPTAYRRAALQTSKNAQAGAGAGAYDRGRGQPNASPPLVVGLVAERERHMAYIRVTDPFRPSRLSSARDALLAWAKANGVAAPPLFGLSHDDPETTPAELCRYDVACLVPETARAGQGICLRTLPAGAYAVVDVSGTFVALAQAWGRLLSEWLPQSGFELGAGPGIERYRTMPPFEAHEHATFDVTLALPIVRRPEIP